MLVNPSACGLTVVCFLFRPTLSWGFIRTSAKEDYVMNRKPKSSLRRERHAAAPTRRPPVHAKYPVIIQILLVALLATSCSSEQQNMAPTFGWYCELHEIGTSEASLKTEEEARSRANAHLASSGRHCVMILKRTTWMQGNEVVRATKPIEGITEEGRRLTTVSELARCRAGLR